MVSCAACLRQIVPGAKFALAGTEVFHRECAPNIANSIGTRQKLEIVQLRQQLASEHMDAARRLDEQARQFNIRNNPKVWQDRIASEEQQRLAAERTANRYKRERDEAKRDAESVRRELEVLQAIAGTRTAPTTPAEPVTGIEQDAPAEDDAAVRFGLLELDPLE